MPREFSRNMFIMLVSIMIGIVIITFFTADIIRQSQIDVLTIEHQTNIQTITSRSENFTNNFFQGTIQMDSAREIREVGNYHFDFGLFWYTNARSNWSERHINNCISNCTLAMTQYLNSYRHFDSSKPFFETAQQYTDSSKYLEILGYYVQFAECGKNITLLRYNASQYLKYAAENLSEGNFENLSLLMDLFNQTEEMYAVGLGDYNDLKGQIGDYWFFDEIREEH